VEQTDPVETEMPHTAPSSLPGMIAAMAGGWRPALRQIAVVLVACVVSVSATWWQMQAVDTQRELSRDVLAAHVRSLLQDKTVQVASDNTHNVKPWFAGRLEFTPVVKDLSAEGFELIGGRVDYVGGRRVAALVYRKGQHQINVFTWPTSDTAPLKFDTAQGYNVASWSRGSMAFWAISDLNPSEMRELPPLL
jgi:anti-sigma factor RsiW